MTRASEPESSPIPPVTDPPIRGLSHEELDRPAGTFLGAIRWDGRPDPDALPAAAFLARL